MNELERYKLLSDFPLTTFFVLFFENVRDIINETALQEGEEVVLLLLRCCNYYIIIHDL